MVGDAVEYAEETSLESCAEGALGAIERAGSRLVLVLVYSITCTAMPLPFLLLDLPKISYNEY